MRTPASIVPTGQTGQQEASMMTWFVKVTTTHSAWSGCNFKPTAGHISPSLHVARLKLHDFGKHCRIGNVASFTPISGFTSGLLDNI
jgi:hypothetical protein